jgi:RND family efflux transporter MFP subunit
MQGPLIALLVVICSLPAVQAQSIGRAPRYAATGVVMANRSVALGAKVMGRVQSVNHEEGDRVEQGDVLLRLESLELQAELTSALASLSLARTELKYKEKLETRMRRLYKAKTLSEEQLDDAIFELEAARDKARIAKAAVDGAKAALKETILAAPFDGVITAKHVEVGQLTDPGATLFVLEDQQQLKFRTNVKEQDVARIEKGDKAIVVIDALDGKALEGQVGTVVPSGDPKTHAFVVEIDLPPHEKLYPGMFGKASFND